MAVMRRCLRCGRVGRWTAPRCPEHQADFEISRERSPRRRAVKAARYDDKHRRLRRLWTPYVNAGTVRCGRARLGQCLHSSSLILTGQSWDLDHLPTGQHPSHADCNRAARRNPARSNT